MHIPRTLAYSLLKLGLRCSTSSTAASPVCGGQGLLPSRWHPVIGRVLYRHRCGRESNRRYGVSLLDRMRRLRSGFLSPTLSRVAGGGGPIKQYPQGGCSKEGCPSWHRLLINLSVRATSISSRTKYSLAKRPPFFSGRRQA